MPWYFQERELQKKNFNTQSFKGCLEKREGTCFGISKWIKYTALKWWKGHFPSSVQALSGLLLVACNSSVFSSHVRYGNFKLCGTPCCKSKCCFYLNAWPSTALKWQLLLCQSHLIEFDLLLCSPFVLYHSFPMGCPFTSNLLGCF